MAYQGKFICKNPSKYRGNTSNIIYRSSWEYAVLKFLDEHENVEWFSSEEYVVPYKNPFTGKTHRYFIDVVFQNKQGKVFAIEIKPDCQTKQPKRPEKVNKRYLLEVSRYGVNVAKWKSAKLICESKGWEFQIWTEKTLKKLGIKIF